MGQTCKMRKKEVYIKFRMFCHKNAFLGVCDATVIVIKIVSKCPTDCVIITHSGQFKSGNSNFDKIVI
jgi:hypothetical protein